MKSRELWCEITLKLHQFGLAGTLTRGVRRIAHELRACVSPQQADTSDFDLKHGTDTSGVVHVGALDLPIAAARHAVRYQAAISDVFISLLNDLPITYNKYLFIDLGSGKGHALLLASDFPFKQIIGVELAPSLHEVACRNICIYRKPTQRMLGISRRLTVTFLIGLLFCECSKKHLDMSCTKADRPGLILLTTRKSE